MLLLYTSHPSDILVCSLSIFPIIQWKINFRLNHCYNAAVENSSLRIREFEINDVTCVLVIIK